MIHIPRINLRQIRFSKRNILIGLVFIVMGGLAVSVISTSTQLSKVKSEAVVSEPIQNENARLIEEIRGIYLLPVEIPTIATVSDKSSLSGQDFFKSAENGDKVLIYTVAKKAVLYRPSIGKIIEVGPVNLTEQKKSEGNVAGVKTDGVNEDVKAENVVITIYNGTYIAGLMLVAKDRLEASLDGPEVRDRVDTENKPYETTLIVDLTGENEALIEEIRDLIGGKVGEVPDGEFIPDSDILIILGQDFADNN